MYTYLDDDAEIEQLAHWTQSTKALSPKALKEAYEAKGLKIMKKALAWSDRVNEIIESLPLSEPFEGVKEAIKRIKEGAHIAVVSSANPAAIEEEWKTSGLYDLVDYFYSQADGTKAECIRKLKSKGYKKNRIIMIGDALGDYKAAKHNDVWFYPILVTKEKESWKNFVDEYLDVFMKEKLDEQKQLDWIGNMKENLS